MTIVRISSAVIDGLSCRAARTNPLLSARSEGMFDSLGLVGVGVSGKREALLESADAAALGVVKRPA